MDLKMPVPKDIETESRILDFFLLLDASGSMAGDKIASLNEAINSIIQTLKNEASEHQVQVMIRCIAFDSSARWHISQPTPLDQFQWRPLSAGNDFKRAMGEALALLADVIPSIANERRKIIPPRFLLFTDGKPTDDFAGGLQRLNERIKSSGIKKAIRMAVAIGDNADRDLLRQFADDSETPVLDAHNKERFVRQIFWHEIDR